MLDLEQSCAIVRNCGTDLEEQMVNSTTRLPDPSTLMVGKTPPSDRTTILYDPEPTNVEKQ
jgi:hypothetical protein